MAESLFGVQCTELNVLSSGHIAVSTDGFTSRAVHTCVNNYNLIGTSTRTCLSDGSWNESAPVCDCEPPSAPMNGTVEADGKTANYTCDIGYTLLGKQVRTCQTDGTGWDDTDPRCNICQSVVTEPGGVSVLATTGTQTYSLFACDTGYTLNGAYKVYCESTGYWETFPTCALCDRLVAPDSGSIARSSTGRITMATYTCSAGYDLNGVDTRTCLINGTWDSTSPTCTCQSPAAIQNGFMIDNGIVATYTCYIGYSLDGTTTRACANDGSGWPGTEAACTPCHILTPPTGGNVSLTTDGYQTNATYTCDLGYTLNGLEIITCRSDGTWDFSQPDCASCPTLTDPESGSVSMTTNAKTTTAKFNCTIGYYVSGPLTITCQTNGYWSSDPPTCKCITPEAPSRGSVSVSDTTQGTVATYLCELGFSINGMVSRLCITDGSGWQGIDPVCSACEYIPTSPELTFNTSTNGSTTSGKYTCAVNYTLSGESSHTCQADSSWDYSIPVCVSCAAIQDPLSGHVVLSTYGLETRATFSCVDGYDTNSTAITTCQTNGTWNLPDPFCICQTPPAVINGYYDIMADGMVTNYTCDVGYEPVGTQERWCLTDGTGWNGTHPICVLIISTTPKLVEGNDKTVLPLPSGVFVALVVIVTMLLLVIALIAVRNYLRFRKERQRIGITFDHSSDSKPISEELRFHFESPDLENGKGRLIAKEMEPKAKFNVNCLKNKTSMLLIDLKKSEKENTDIPQNVIEKSTITTGHGRSPSLPLSSVRLPKLPQKPPCVHRHTRHRRKRLRQELSEKPVDTTEPKLRASTPLEILMERQQTPDILSAEPFEYIQPVYCHKVETPEPSSLTSSEASRTVTALLDNKDHMTESIV